jgi:hypothetical protein
MTGCREYRASLLLRDSLASPGTPSKEVVIMFKRIIIASALALFSIRPAAAESLTTSHQQAVSAAPANSAAVEACERQMRRMAGLNKALAANYNAERIYDDCEGQSDDDHTVGAGLRP